MDIPTLATAAVAVITPYLTEGTKEAVKAGAKDLYGWMKAKLTGEAGEALAKLEKTPADADRQAALRVQLKDLLADNSALVAELTALLPKDAGGGSTQTIIMTGNNGKAGQADRGSTVNIS